MMEPLTIYKASAGSGKTFRLAVDYISLLVKDPYSYRSILAVTFTNKATEEMKMRIISQLFGLWKSLPSSDVYLDEVCRKLDVGPEIVKKQAHDALVAILHNYSYFRVGTIDSFFQSVMRNMARELDLTANLRLDLNDDEVKDEAVDTLITSLEEKDEVMQRIIDYVMQNIDDDKGWNVIRNIKNFGKRLFDDEYKAFNSQLDIYGDDARFDEIEKMIAEKKRKSVENIDHLCDEFDKAILECPCDASFKTVPITYFKNLRNKNYTKLNANISKFEDSQEWVSKKNPNRSIQIDYAVSTLIPILKKALENVPSLIYDYYNATLTLSHLRDMRLLSSIEKTMRQLNMEANRFMLSDTPQILDNLISGDDAPFVFEKIGAMLEHIMIDEFQDTSVIQWRNFKKLLLECMSHRYTQNLIVGDVKQSIYRWRSGDWRLLNNISDEFGKEQIRIENLDKNYRSEKRIIAFNNAFFNKAVEEEMAYMHDEDINDSDIAKFKMAYSDVKQIYPKENESSGYVHISLYPKPGKDETDKDEIQLSATLDAAVELIDAGYAPSSIAILVRNNRYIPKVASYFAQHRPDIKIVSNEAFSLGSSTSVNIIVSAMQVLLSPDDVMSKAYLVKAYQNEVLKKNLGDNLLYHGIEFLNEYLPDEFVKEIHSLSMLPLYELAEKLYNIFSLDELPEQNAFVCAFFDKIADFVESSSSDINLFIEQWKSTIYKFTIQSDNADGISIFSIHKSKGLEFDNVIIPFCDWKMEKAGNTIWCSPKEGIYKDLKLVSIDFQKTALFSMYNDDYLEEHFQNIVDNMNLLYVAFTRAVKNLYIIGREGDRNSRTSLIGKCLDSIARELNADYAAGDNENATIFDYGELLIPSTLSDKSDTDKGADKNADNVFLSKPTPLPIKIASYKSDVVKFRQSNKSIDFLRGDMDVESSKRRKGVILHELLSSIRTIDDVDNVLRSYVFDGKIDEELVSVSEIRDMLNRGMNNEIVRDWFSGRWQLFNECSIITSDTSGELFERRPDRVMTDGNQVVVVDFKFGHQREKHFTQVAQYMSLLSRMGYTDISGYLWYVAEDKIIEIK
jgi:ATP-dependent exoDNAse (exonuclease V) beta subunit/CRISPR/Cas system-associated exonuclease Cas4 (RecB family)